MSVVRVYKSTDIAAPVHPSNVRGSLAALLRACLVTGYGSGGTWFEPAGWEEPFEALSDRACFRAVKGARQLYAVNESLVEDSVATLIGYDSMSSVTTGNGWGVTKYFGKRHKGTDAYSTQWWVVADETTCYVFLRGMYGITPHGFGEFYSLVDVDPYNSFIAGHQRSDGLPYTNGDYIGLTAKGSLTSTSYRYISIRGDAMGRGVATSVAPVSFTGSANHATYDGDLDNTKGVPGLRHAIVPVWHTEGSGRAYYRGKFRGLYHPVAQRPEGSGVEVVVDGRTYLAITAGAASSYYSQLWVDITGSWET